MSKVDPQRIAEIRAAWKQDREDEIADWRANWPMHVIKAIADLIYHSGLGIALGLSWFLYFLHSVQ